MYIVLEIKLKINLTIYNSIKYMISRMKLTEYMKDVYTENHKHCWEIKENLSERKNILSLWSRRFLKSDV